MNKFLHWFTAFNLLFGTASLAAIPTTRVADGSEPAIASHGSGNVSIAFLASLTNGAVHNVLFSTLESNQSWTKPIDVSNNASNCSHPNIAIEPGGTIDLIWTGTNVGTGVEDIFLARSVDGGKHWTEPKNISRTGAAMDSDLAVGPDNSIHIVWQSKASGTNSSNIFYTCSTNGGTTWSKAENVSNTPKRAMQPAIAVDDSGLANVCWLDSRSGEQRPDVFYIRRLGGSWTTPLNISDSPRLSAHPGLACGPKGKVYIIWVDHSRKEKSPDIWCAVGNKKERFAKPINISDSPGVSSQPAIAADDRGRVVVVWSDTSPGVADIYGRISTDRADDFTTILDMPHTIGDSTDPHVTICGDSAFAVWEEDEGKGSRIEFAELPLKDVPTGPLRPVDPVRHPAATSRNH